MESTIKKLYDICKKDLTKILRCWQDSNLRGMNPNDFESYTLTTRSQHRADDCDTLGIQSKYFFFCTKKCHLDGKERPPDVYL
jgi:hypothetical protein